MAEPPLRRQHLQIARVVGVPVLLAPSWFLLPAYLFLESQSLLRQQVGAGRAVLLAGSIAVLLLLSVLLHELGHCLVARAFGLPVASIRITLLAGYTEITQSPESAAREYAIAASGPMVSILLTGISLAAAGQFADNSLSQLVCQASALSNGAIAVLNLLPGLPLDGGRVLRSILWQLGKDEQRATRISARIGIGLALSLPVILVSALPSTGAGQQAGIALVSLAVGLVMYVGAAQTLRQSQVSATLPSLSAAALARPALAVTATTPLAEALRRAHESQLHALVVVDGNGRLEGIVSENWVRQVPQERRPWVVVADGARRIERGLLLDPGLVGEQLLDAMNATPASEYVVWGDTPTVLASSDVAAALGR